MSFNVFIDKDTNGNNGYGIPLYTQTINLVNGQSLKDIWNTYSLHPDYKQVCIVWEKKMETRRIGFGTDTVENVCYTINADDSNQARVDWETLGGSSSTPQHSPPPI